MTLADKLHQKRMDLRRMVREMRDISPKTSTYQKLAAQVDKIQIELAEMGAVRTAKKPLGLMAIDKTRYHKK